MKHRFKAAPLGRGPNGAWVFLPIPLDVEQCFGTKARVPVTGTLNGVAFRGSLLPNGDGTHSMPLDKELRARVKAVPGEEIAVLLERDDAHRTVTVPPELTEALKPAKHLRDAFAKLSYSSQKEFVDWIVQAKKAETRARRVEKTLELIAAGKRLKG